MAGKTERQTLKRAAILALDESRASLGDEVSRMRSQWNPRKLVRQSLERHKLALGIAAAIAGVVVTRLVLTTRRGGAPRASFSGKITSLAVTALWSVFHRPVMDFAKSRLASYLDRLHQSPTPAKPNEPA